MKYFERFVQKNSRNGVRTRVFSSSKFSRNFKNKKNEAGDTLVEVLIAITVMGIIVAGAMSVMNHALATIIDTSERTAVRAEINAQTELLHYIHAKDENTWKKLKQIAFSKSSENLKKVADSCGLNENANFTRSVPGSFYLVANDNLSSVSLRTNPKGNKDLTSRATAVNGAGIWLDAIYYPRNNSNAAPYFDFYIKACWDALGSHERAQSVTIVRIYDQK